MKSLKDHINDSLDNTNEIVSKLIFISHASKDSEIVNEFIDSVLRLSCGFSSDEIAYTSREDTGVRPGDKINEYIRDNIYDAKIVLLMISDNYKQSEVCLNEMGAAFALNKTIIPVLMPEIGFDQLGWLLTFNKAIRINASDSLDAFYDKVCLELNRTKNATEWNLYKTKFLDFCSSYFTSPLSTQDKNDETYSTLLSVFDVVYIVRGFDEGEYHFQINLWLRAHEDLTIKKIELCNKRPFYGTPIKGKDRLLLKYFIEQNIIDIAKINQNKYLKQIETLYNSRRNSVMDLSFKKHDQRSVSFNGAIFTIRESDGYDELQTTGWSLKISFNINEVLVVPIEMRIIDGRWNEYWR